MATHTYSSRERGQPAARSAAQMLSFVFGLTFLAVGIAGFIPGVTENASEMATSGPDSPARLLDVFQVSVLHNVVHIAFGILGMVAAKGAQLARNFLVLGGVVYLLLFAYGMVIDLSSEANFVPFNEADNWLHLGLGAAMVVLGLMTTRAYDARETVD